MTKEGYDKSNIRGFLNEKVGNPSGRLNDRGFVGIGLRKGPNDAFFKVIWSPEDTEVVVTDGKGGYSGAIIPWSLHSELVVRSVLLPDGSIPDKVNDFHRTNWIEA